MSTADDALQQLVEQQKYVDKTYPPRNTLRTLPSTRPSATVPASLSTARNSSAVLLKVDHTSEMAGAALFKAHVGMDKLVEKTSLAFDSIEAFARQKARTLMG